MKEGKFRLHKVLATSVIMLFLSGTVSFASHKNYFVKTSVDYGGFGIMSEVVTDDPKGKNTGTGGTGDDSSPYAEEKGGYSYSKVMHYGNISKGGNADNTDGSHLQISFLADRSSPETRLAQYEALKETSDKGLVFSFPGLKAGMNGGYKATSNDYMRASLVSETLTTGLNQALLFIKNNANDDMSSNYSLQLALSKLSYTSEDKSYVVTMGGTKYRIQPATAQKELIPVNNLNVSDYVKITALNGPNGEVYSYFPWRMAKGYYPTQPMYDYVNKGYRENVKGNENEYLTWGQLILQAMLNYDVHGKTEQDFAGDVQTIIGQGLGSDLSRTISSMRNMLGLAPMQELVLNMGARPANYHMGAISNDVRNVSLTMYVLILIISLTFLAFTIIKLILQKMASTTNVIAKTSLMEGIQDIAFVAVALGFFPALFEILLELNYLIVRTFSYSSEYMTAFSILGGKNLAMESMAGFILSTMFLSVDFYINCVYLVRELTLAFLYSISPAIIVSYLWSPQQKQLVFGFFREIVGNIFMQSFHAITMSFFAGYNTANLSNLQALASAYCFIPITQLFRQLILGKSGGFSETTGGKLAGQLANTTTGLQKTGVTYANSKRMIDAQATASMKQAGWSAGGQVAGSLASAGAGAAIGTMIAPGIGTVVGGAIGGLVSSAGSAVGAMSANKEIGKASLKNSESEAKMGLAELGMGLGVSAYDGAGAGMVNSGLATLNKSAENRGKADALYNPNNPGGFGDASLKYGAGAFMGTAGGAMAGGINRMASEHMRNQPQTYGPVNDKANSLHGLNELKANHVHEFRNFNQARNEVDMITTIKMDELKNNNQFAELNEAYNLYRNRDASPQGKIDWAKKSNETGILAMAENLSGQLELKLDTARSGFVGMRTDVLGEKYFKVDESQSRRKVDTYGDK